ncbi:hypothetical protein [Bradyrhizobium sp. CCGUVB1N3]|nr:hypothetical protein [Bradyrhizobium sp. CCGUVB1N3]
MTVLDCIDNVALKVGFDDPGYFTRLFRRNALFAPPPHPSRVD